MGCKTVPQRMNRNSFRNLCLPPCCLYRFLQVTVVDVMPTYNAGFRIHGILIGWKNPEPGPFLASMMQEKGAKDPRGQGFKVFSKDLINAFSILSISSIFVLIGPKTPFSMNPKSPANRPCISNSQTEPYEM